MKTTIYILPVMIVVFACNRKTPAAAGDLTATPVATTTRTVIADSGLSVPTCIQHKIDSIKKLPVWNPPAEVHEYEYAGKKVYLISADCCDFFTTAFDENCTFVCAPSGGFTGRGDGRCKDFYQQAKMIRLVWKDNRSRK